MKKVMIFQNHNQSDDGRESFRKIITVEKRIKENAGKEPAVRII